MMPKEAEPKKPQGSDSSSMPKEPENWEDQGK